MRHLWNCFCRELGLIKESPRYLILLTAGILFSYVFFLTFMHEGQPENLPIAVVDQDGSYTFRFQYDYDPEMARRGYLCVDKGSVTVNGVSLTVCQPDVEGDLGYVSVCIIPYTQENTNFRYMQVGSVVNLEFDILGKYIARYAAVLK